MVLTLAKKLCLLLVFMTSTLVAQKDQSYTLSEVTISGLRKTDEFVARRLLQSQYGDKVSMSQIAADAQNISNIPGIDHVSYTIDTIGQELHVSLSLIHI